jgi:hypothetical protein
MIVYVVLVFDSTAGILPVEMRVFDGISAAGIYLHKIQNSGNTNQSGYIYMENLNDSTV